MHNLFRLSTGAWRDGFFKHPRMDRELLSQHGKGIIGTTGCPSGEVQVHLRHGNYDAARKAAGDFQDILGRENYFLELMDHGLDIENRVRDGLLRPRPRTSASRCWPPTTPTTSMREDAPSRRSTCCASTPAPRWTSPPVTAPASASRSPATATTSSPPQEMRALWADKYQLREACDNTLLIAERCDVEFSEGVGNYMPQLPLPAGGERGLLAGQGGRARPARAATRRASPSAVRKQAEFEIGVITQMGFPGYFLVVADFINWAKNNGIRVGPGPRLGRGLDGRLRDADHRPRPARARPDLRALPQPRPRLDARLRHRLRRAPAQRGDPLRHREVRRRPGLLHRHLRHHQGQAGGQGLLADPRLPLRDGRPDHQGDARRGDGQGRAAARRSSTPSTRATARAGSSASSTTATTTCKRGRRHRHRHRGAQAAVGRARGRRDHVQRAAGGRDPAAQAARRRRDDHPVRLPHL